MADRPILFSGPMVRALLAGRKTQTRRLVNFPGVEKVMDFVKVATDKDGRPVYEMKDAAGSFMSRPAGKGLVDYHFSPRIGVGDRLWVRETWSHTGDHDFSISEARMSPFGYAIYQADDNPDYPHAKFWPSIHMPREFSRLTLIVTDVRVERLQSISEADALAEGAEPSKHPGMDGGAMVLTDVPGVTVSPGVWYRWLWDEINGKGAWKANPWVVAYTFRVIKQNIDQIEKVAA
ncbi:hypothetical protein JVX98_13080 [Ensifer sp. PDNC004]|uniref:hypothetical protein n=1 Tax=Ensifer sp. PDNC004 TaxID=2811423 RepID=UPI0019637683|nr:hypothetical protein [Ensifer sp. PDNC004]QRY69151.1 hypothetical protein JVX98_13080 [Ensifer sp. PDNC004]